VGQLPELANLVDLDRYPIADVDSSRRGRLIDRCRADMAAVGASVLPSFVLPTAVAQMVSEVAWREHLAFHKVKQHNVYLQPEDPGFPHDHPRNETVTSTSATLGNHHLQDADTLQALYASPLFKQFVADVLGYEALYPYADPVSGVNVLYYPPGTTLGWHFDNSTFTTTLMIREAQAGAAFEYIPFVRTDEDPAYALIGNLLRGDRSGIRTVNQADGTLVLFAGSRTVHRVTPVEGETTRLLATFTFAPEPGAQISAVTQKTFYDYDGPSPAC
jgi:hypothetical protein